MSVHISFGSRWTLLTLLLPGIYLTHLWCMCSWTKYLNQQLIDCPRKQSILSIKISRVQIISTYLPMLDIDPVCIDKDPCANSASPSTAGNTVSHISDCYTLNRKPFWCLPIDCSHKAVRKRKCQRKRRAGESLITAEAGWAASMRGQQLWSPREVSVRRSQSVQSRVQRATPLISSGQWFVSVEEEHVNNSFPPRCWWLFICSRTANKKIPDRRCKLVQVKLNTVTTVYKEVNTFSINRAEDLRRRRLNGFHLLFTTYTGFIPTRVNRMFRSCLLFQIKKRIALFPKNKDLENNKHEISFSN